MAQPRPVTPAMTPTVTPAPQPSPHPAHIPVLRDAAVCALLESAPPDGVFLDATFGAGGHSAEILRRMPARAKLIAVDCDAEAETRARADPFQSDSRFRFVRRNFADIAEILRERETPELAGALFDLGASSMQMDSPERGFSFRCECPPDMRMDRDNPKLTAAAQWIRLAERARMEKTFREYGEEPEARRVARALAENRRAANSARELAELIRRAKKIPSKPGVHPATRVFQALRIAVNNELACLRRALESVHRALCVGGRLVVVAFHSLEDRIVKQFANGETLPDIGRVVARRFRMAGEMRRPDDAELAANPRARSAKMRALIKLPEGGAE